MLVYLKNNILGRLIKQEILYTGSNFARSLKVDIHESTLVTPTYFPSISGASTRFDLKQLIDVILRSGYPRVLVSAFDLSRFSGKIFEVVKNSLHAFQSENKFVFLDSGAFEKYWLKDDLWNFQSYAEIIRKVPSDFYASYDDIAYPGLSSDAIVRYLIENSSIKLSSRGQCLTVLHGGPGKLSEVVRTIASTHPELCSAVSVPEKECGKTIETRINTIRKIRKILDDGGIPSFIHILGCGNPISMVLFTMAGADSFDSVDWSRWLINRENCQFTDMTHLSLLGCGCMACKKTDLDFVTKGLYHNLLYYQEFLTSYRTSIRDNSEYEFLKPYLSQKSLCHVVNLFSNKDF